MIRFLALIAALSPLLLVPAGALAQAGFDQEKCSLCHIRDSVFLQPGFLNPERSKEFDEERLCGSCHNGSVEDSRGVLWRGEQHPAPPAKRKDRGCSVCHSPHTKGGWSVLAGSGVPLRRGGNAVCTGCHPSYRSSKIGPHLRSSAESMCRDCHQAHGGTGKALLRESGVGLCLRCHGELDPSRGGGHPVAELRGAASSRMPVCTACHPVHQPGEIAAAPTARCAGCHPFDEGKGREAVKRHTGEENCSSCHTFHARAGGGGRAFRGKDIRVESVCRGCHTAYWAGDVAAGRSNGTHVTFSKATKAEICTRCHSVHRGTAGTPLLRTAKPYFCLECHESQNTIREIGGVALAHPVFEKLGKGRLTEVAREKKLSVGPGGEIICATCHKVHGSTPGTSLLAPGSEKGESCFWCHGGKRGSSHKAASREPGNDCAICHATHGRKSTGSDPWIALCRSCHPRDAVHKPGREDREVGRSDDLPDFDSRGRKSSFGDISCPTCHQPHGMTAEPKRLRKNYRPGAILCTTCHRRQESIALTPHDLRGISGDSACEPCHVPHAGAPPWMWGMKRGTGEIAEETCRACHPGKGGKGAGTPVAEGGHPRNVMASRPMPDGFPLYGPGGDTTRKGVVSCPTCHEVHGTGIMPTGRGVEKLLRRTDGSGSGARGKPFSCTACHSGKETAHGKADCIGCHPPHSEEKPERICSGCHRVGEGLLLGKHRSAGKSCGSCHSIHGSGGGKASESGCAGCHPGTLRIRKTSHAAIGDSSCDPCHPVHRDPPTPVIKWRIGEDPFVPNIPCLRCHAEGGIAPVPAWPTHPSRESEVPTNYGAKVVLETPISMLGRYKEGDRPLFPLFGPDGKRSLSGVMGCLTCHDPHAGGMRDGEPSANAYLRDPGHAFLAELCSSCHRGDTSDRVRNFHKLPRKGH